ncbi:MAG: MotA/TolQ/ExbB proton channel family protein [Bdellovibrionales bacterium]|nr:MotA/TolQ/ExbB proton channel family protein [Bdellovibrionales bacterium]
MARRLDFSTFIGIVAAFGLVAFAIQLEGGLRAFLNTKAILVVVGGTLGATLVNFPLGDFARTLRLLRAAFFPNPTPIAGRITQIVECARRFRNDGAEALGPVLREERDRFFRQSLELVAEGFDEREIRKVLELELEFSEDRHRRGAQLFQTMGMIAPAMGLIGTLIGLVQMLQTLEDPAGIGPGMAIALLTTFYGAVLAYLVFIPIAGKLRARSEEEILFKELTIEGVAGIAEGANPRMIERRLLTFLPPEQRSSEYE